jgi:hypothetical protein
LAVATKPPSREVKNLALFMAICATMVLGFMLFATWVHDFFVACVAFVGVCFAAYIIADSRRQA